MRLIEKRAAQIVDICCDGDATKSTGHVLAEEGRLVSTNGHILVRCKMSRYRIKDFELSEDSDILKLSDKLENVTISRTSLKEAVKSITKNKANPVTENIVLNNDSCVHLSTIGDKGITISSKPIQNNQYPDWKRITPTDKPNNKLTLSVEVLEKLTKIAKKSGESYVKFDIFTDPKKRQITRVIPFRTSDDVEGLIMPVDNV